MVSLVLKNFAKKNGFTVEKQLAYGFSNGYLVTLYDNGNMRMAHFSCLFDSVDAENEIKDFLDQKETRKQYGAFSCKTAPSSLVVAFADLKKLGDGLQAVTDKLSQLSVKGEGYCPECGMPLYQNGRLLQFDDKVICVHSECAQKMEDDLKNEKEANRSEGNLIAGIIGALLGALIGAIPWALVAYAGWTAAIIGLAISAVCKKGYELLKGKKTRIKLVVIFIASLLSVVIGEFAALLIIATKELGGNVFYAFMAVNILLKEGEGVFDEFMNNVVLGWFFAIVGMVPTLRAISAEVKGNKFKVIDPDQNQ